MKTYAVIYNQDEVRENSSSGGMFSAIANKFDVVYGVALTEDCYGAEMKRVEGDISSIRGSKYLQAKMGSSFKMIKDDLENGKRVLFTGLGCQINGLVMFLGKRYENLFLVDVICHGVPSPKLWKLYLKHQETKYGKINKVNFRCKDNGWLNFGIKENQSLISKYDDFFMRAFLNNYCLRPSCYDCNAKTYRNSDMTIADFWGIENVCKDMNDDKGTSLVIARTKKAEEIFEQIKSDLKWKEVSYDDGVRHNPCEYSSVTRPKERDVFFKDLDNMSIEDMEKKYFSKCNTTLCKKIIIKINNLLKKTISLIEYKC